MVVSGARLSSLLWENRGFAALPRDRCASSFSQSLGRKHFYTGSNPNWCRLNILSKLARWYANRTLARSTARSIVERSSDFVRPPVAGSTSTPRDSVQASGSAPAARPPLLTVLLSDRSITKSRVLLSVSSFGPSALRPYGPRLLWPRMTSGHASEHLSMSVANDRHTARSPRVLRALCHAYSRRIYVAAFRTRIGLCICLPAHPATPPLSASCSSRQRFAFGFLQTPSRPGRPCRAANGSPCRVRRGLSPPRRCALPGAQTRTPRRAGRPYDPGLAVRFYTDWRGRGCCLSGRVKFYRGLALAGIESSASDPYET